MKSLQAYLKLDTPALLTIMETYFADLFDIALLNEEAEYLEKKSQAIASPYLEWFKMLIAHLELFKKEDQYQEGKVIARANDWLCYKDVSSYKHTYQVLLKKRFDATTGEVRPAKQQAGLFESLMLGQVHPRDLLPLDMFRVLKLIHQSTRYQSFSYQLLNIQRLALFRQNAMLAPRYYIVNMQEKAALPPRWILIDTQKKMVETDIALHVPEKVKLKAAFQGEDLVYQEGLAEEGVASGYKVLVKIDEIIRRTNISRDANFSILRDDVYTTVIFDSDKSPYSLVNADEPYISNEARWCLLQCRDLDSALTNTSKTTVAIDSMFMIRLFRLARRADLHKDFKTYENLSEVMRYATDQQWNKGKFLSESDKGIRLALYRADMTLQDGNYAMIQDKKSLFLNLKQLKNYSAFSDQHTKVANRLHINAHLVTWILRSGERVGLGENPISDLASALLITAFRTLAKYPTFNIDYGSHNITQDECKLIERLVDENPYLQHIVTSTSVLQTLLQALKPALARNAFLAEQDYNQPPYADHWFAAGRYSITKLSENFQKYPNTLTTAHNRFRSYVANMGVKLLRKQLQYLTEHSRGLWLNLTGEAVFYAAFPATDYADYMQSLSGYLADDEVCFPFNTLEFCYQPVMDDRFTQFLSIVNKSTRPCESIMLTGITEQHVNSLLTLLKGFVKACQTNAWHIPLAIPYLDKVSKEPTKNKALLTLIDTYETINTLVLATKRKQKAIVWHKEREKTSGSTHYGMGGSSDSGEENNNDEVDTKDIWSQENIDTGFPLSLNADVEFQHQHQHQHDYQKEKQYEVSQKDDLLRGRLVNYANIHNNQYLKEVCNEIKCNSNQLPAFFKRWVSANVEVKQFNRIPHVIHWMTERAAEKLLRYDAVFGEGIDSENLPQGFSIVENEHEESVLCYSAEYGFSRRPTPLTTELYQAPGPIEWLGNHRQFLTKLAPLLQDDNTVNPTVWKTVLLFDQLQANALSIHASYAKAIVQREKIQKRPEGNLLIADQVNLLSGGEQLDEAFMALWTAKNSCALGGVYNEFGSTVTAAFLTQLQKIMTSLGQTHFKVFKECFIDNTHDLMPLASITSMQAIDRMLEKLDSSLDGSKALWLHLIQQHMHYAKVDSFERLWHGFEYFSKALGDEEISLPGNMIGQLRTQNMLVFLDRVLRCVTRLATTEQKNAFISQLPQLDLSHGGVHYAVTYEGFLRTDKALQLTQFQHGMPTYTPNLADLYKEHSPWKSGSLGLCYLQRMLAKQAWLDEKGYHFLIKQFQDFSQSAKHQLVLLLNTQFEKTNSEVLAGAWQTIIGIPSGVIGHIAQNLQYAVYRAGAKPAVQLACLPYLGGDLASLVLKRYASGLVLEAASLLWNKCLAEASSVAAAISVFQHILKHRDTISLFLRTADVLQHMQKNRTVWALANDVLKLSVIMGVMQETVFNRLFNLLTPTLHAATQQDIAFLFHQFLSVNFSKSQDLTVLSSTLWHELTECVKTIDAHNKAGRFGEARAARKALLVKYQSDLSFSYSLDGVYRDVTETDVDIMLLGVHRYKPEIKAFLTDHLVLTRDNESEERNHVNELLKNLQATTTETDELREFLLLLQDKDLVKPQTYWNAGYFYALYAALKPENPYTAYPFSLLRLVLSSAALATQERSLIQERFPRLIADTLQQEIVNESSWSQSQRQHLTKLLLVVFEAYKNKKLFNQIKVIVTRIDSSEKREALLSMLARGNDKNSLGVQWDLYRSIQGLQKPAVVSERQWERTIARCLQWSTAQIGAIFNAVFTPGQQPTEHTILLAYIIVNSLVDRSPFAKGQVDKDLLQRKLSKLEPALKIQSIQTLKLLASYYESYPAPTADDVLRLLKTAQIATYANNPHQDAFRQDYGHLSPLKYVDLERMLSELRISGSTPYRDGKSLTLKQRAAFLEVFLTLKAYERGVRLVNKTRVNRLTLPALKTALSKSHGVKRWALLFDVLYRTTGMYPNLAQQVGVLVNDSVIQDKRRGLQLDTGEGKTLMIALRAAKHALDGKSVDIITAKTYLAKRDHEEFAAFFEALGLKTVYVDPSCSQMSDYHDARVRYATPDSISLFFAQVQWQGTPLGRTIEKGVALVDEFDEVYFEQTEDTQFNYATSIGQSAQQWAWFYELMNDFYQKNEEHLEKHKVVPAALLQSLVDKLTALTKQDAFKRQQMDLLTRKRVNLLIWLKAAATAVHLKRDVHYFLHRAKVHIDGEDYLRDTIVPTSKTNQPMWGASFAQGVQQLLGAQLNKQQQNVSDVLVHISANSYILSSQIAETQLDDFYAHVEGFSATYSAQQLAQLQRPKSAFPMLRVPTNQPIARRWAQPEILNNEADRLQAMVVRLKKLLRAQESILIACRNDKQVKTIRDALKQALPAYSAQIVEHTNDLGRSVDASLAEKRRLEAFDDVGCRTKGVVFIASSVGRGNNLGGVGAVFLLVPETENLLRQKGGRTARFGQEGEVFQYYLSTDIAKDLASFQRNLQSLWQGGEQNEYARFVARVSTNVKLKKKDTEALGGTFSAADERMETFRLWQAEHHRVQGEVDRLYKWYKSTLSIWGMAKIAELHSDPHSEEEIKRDVSRSWMGIMEDMPRDWENVLREKETRMKRIGKIEVLFLGYARRFLASAKLGNEHLPHFKLPAPQLTEKTESTNVRRLRIENAILMRLFSLHAAGLMTTSSHHRSQDTSLGLVRVSEILTGIKEEKELQTLLQSCLSAKTFSDAKASILLLHNEQHNQSFSQSLEKAFSESVALLGVQWEPGNISETSPVDVATVRTYVHRLPASMRLDAVDYMHAMPRLLLSTPKVLRQARFQLPALRLHHFECVWLFANTLDEPKKWLAIIGDIMASDPIKATRLLLQADGLARRAKAWDESAGKALLASICHVLSVLKSPQDWMIAEKLLEKTRDWWTRLCHTDKDYRISLQQLWSRLADNRKQFSTLLGHIKVCLSQPGKSWFLFLNELLAVTPVVVSERRLAALVSMQGSKTMVTKALRVAVKAADYAWPVSVIQCVLEIVPQEWSSDRLQDCLSRLHRSYFVEQENFRWRADNNSAKFINIVTVYFALIRNLISRDEPIHDLPEQLANGAYLLLTLHQFEEKFAQTMPQGSQRIIERIRVLQAVRVKLEEPLDGQLRQLSFQVVTTKFLQALLRTGLALHLSVAELKNWINNTLDFVSKQTSDKAFYAALKKVVTLYGGFRSLSQESSERWMRTFIETFSVGTCSAMNSLYKTDSFVSFLPLLAKHIDLSRYNEQGIQVVLNLLIKRCSIDAPHAIKKYLLSLQRMQYQSDFHRALSIMRDANCFRHWLDFFIDCVPQNIMASDFSVLASQFFLFYRRVKDKDPSLNLLKEKPLHIRTNNILRSYFIRHLEHQVDKDHKELVWGVHRIFQEAYATASNESAILTDRRIATWFDFSKPDSRLPRILFLQLLQTSDLVTINNTPNQPLPPSEWTKAKNDRLFTYCLKKYAMQKRMILNEQSREELTLREEEMKPVEVDMWKVRNLNAEQFSGFMNIVEEMHFIFQTKHKRHKRLSLDVNNFHDCGLVLQQLIAKYESAYGKANERKEAFLKLKTAVSRILAQDNDNQQNKSRSHYHRLYHLLQKEKLSVLNEDMRLNNERTWFKMNRGGASRYLNVLTQMQEAVLQYWFNDMNHYHDLGRVRHYFREDMSLYIRLLQKGIQQWMAQNPKYCDKQNATFALFGPLQRKLHDTFPEDESILVDKPTTLQRLKETFSKLISDNKRQHIPKHLLVLFDHLNYYLLAWQAHWKPITATAVTTLRKLDKPSDSDNDSDREENELSEHSDQHDNRNGGGNGEQEERLHNDNDDEARQRMLGID